MASLVIHFWLSQQRCKRSRGSNIFRMSLPCFDSLLNDPHEVLYQVSFGVTIIFGILSSLTHHHAFFVVLAITIGLIGSCMFAFAEGNEVRYAGIALASPSDRS